MKSALLVAVGSFVVSGCTQTSVSTPAPVQGTAATVGPAAGVAPGAAATSPGPTPEQIAARNDSLVKDRTMHVNEVLAQIAGKEQMPAEQVYKNCLLYTSPSPRDGLLSRMPSSA